MVSALLYLLLLAGGASAAPGCTPAAEKCPPLLEEFGEFGSAAGQIKNPRGIAADPVTGHIFVAEAGQERISEFDARWEFVKTWGWGVIDGSAELQVCTSGTECGGGLEGAGAGQLSDPTGITLDDEGNVWVLDFSNLRLQKFSPAGQFLLMVGGEVNKSKVQEREEQEANTEPVTVTEAEENLCTAASGNECGKGTSGVGQGQFKALHIGNPLDLGPGGTIFVGDENRIQEFGENGAYLGDIPLPGAGRTRSLTVDPTGRLYVISVNVKEMIVVSVDENEPPIVKATEVVREVGPGGEELGRLMGEWEGRKTPKDPLAVAADAEGNVYVTGKVVYGVQEGANLKQVEKREAVAFDDTGDMISFEPVQAGFGDSSDGTDLISVATNVVGDGSGAPGEVFLGHYAVLPSGLKSYIRSYGVPFEISVGEPVIDDHLVTAATTDEATVEASINPRFTADTTYQVQFGTGKCWEGDCESLAPEDPAQLGGGAVNSPQKTGPVALTGLAPDTTYHYRFVAENEAGGPVIGEEGSFRTFDDAPVPACPNDVFRNQTGMHLPDCRAYEMVSPVDKEGGEIYTLRNTPNYLAEISQGNPSGDGLTYSSYRAFANPESAPFTSQYMAERDPGKGWSSRSISPRQDEAVFTDLDTQFGSFTEDLSIGWLVSDSEPPLAEGALPGYRNLYRRDNPSGGYQAQCPAQPPVTAASAFRFEPQGHSADGSHLIFRANDKLTADASATPGLVQLYECVDGIDLRLVSVLPGGEASSAGGSLGTAGESTGDINLRRGNGATAVSSDGSRIFWTADAKGAGPLYVRIDGNSTIEIAGGNARFRAASPNGTRVVYSVDEELREASVGTESANSSTIADEVDGFMGASENAELVYFVSREDLDAEGDAQAGEPNLYLYRAEADTYDFIAILSAEDAREEFNTDEVRPVLTPIALSPNNRSSRVTSDGLHAAFTSTARLTGFDNTDQQSGKADAEVFVYDAEAEELACASCNPAGARPRGENAGDFAFLFWAAAKIPGWSNQGHASRALSDDGGRLFFEASDALALEDTNGVQDVYQWEAPGSGTCTASSRTYSPANDGCVDLISSGKSPQRSEFVDASSDGEDVFFKTTESLWSPDPGLTDIYDARMEGGFPPPPPPKESCLAGENCQSRPPAPTAPSFNSSSFVGPGDEVEKAKTKPKRCRKGTHRVRKAGKVRCVKNRQHRRTAKGGTGR